MAKNIKNDKSNSYIYNFSKTGNEDAYYMCQVMFNDGSYNIDWDVDQKGYYLVLVNVKYDKETRTPHSPNFLFSDVTLLILVQRRSEGNFNKALEMMQEVAEKRIEIMEKDKETFRQMGVKDEEVDNMVEKIRKAMQEENIGKKESDNVKKEVLRVKPVEDKKEERKKKDKEKLTFDDVAGMEDTKEVFLDVIDQLNNPEKYEYFDIEQIKSVLLYGSPGVGKTYIANIFANMIDADFVKVNMGDIASKYQGQTGKNIKRIFDNARNSDKFTVIFWDEIDAVANRRGAEENSKEKNATLNVLLTEMSSDYNENIFMIFATNFIELLDPAFLRSKRCDIKIEIPLPNFETRLQILELNTKKKPLGRDVDLEKIAERTDGKNCADMSLLCSQSARIALKKDKTEINQEDFIEALNKMNNNEKEMKVKKIGFESQCKVEIND